MSNIELATPQYPFSPGLLLGDTLYVSGHLGIDLATGKRPADLESEARVMMDAFQRTIQASHMLMDDLVSVTVYCTDLSAFATFTASTCNTSSLLIPHAHSSALPGSSSTPTSKSRASP